MRQANVELHIEELILHDLPYDQRHRVASAIEAELARLLAEQGLPPGWAEGPQPLDAARVQVNPRLSAEVVGQQVARSVFDEMTNNQTFTATPAEAGGGQGE